VRRRHVDGALLGDYGRNEVRTLVAALHGCEELADKAYSILREQWARAAAEEAGVA
jgi:hypothetical protein